MPTGEDKPGLGPLDGESFWLSGMDSNHDKELQRLLCYHYTTGQGGYILTSWLRRRKGKRARAGNPNRAIDKVGAPSPERWHFAGLQRAGGLSGTGHKFDDVSEWH